MSTLKVTNIQHANAANPAISLAADGSVSILVVSENKTASYTLALTDASKAIEMNVATANNLTVPPNSSVAFPVGTQLIVVQIGAGTTTLVAGSGVTVNSKDGNLELGGQFSGVTLIKRGTDSWIAVGDLAGESLVLKVAGYVAGGFDEEFTLTDTVIKFLFETDASSTLATGLSTGKFEPAAFASDTSGYVAGGQNDDFAQTDTVDKILFSTDARSTLAIGLSSARFGASGFASDTNGYVAGGFDEEFFLLDVIDKFLFSTDERSTLGAGLSSGRRRAAAFESNTSGYVAGGFDDNFDIIDTVDKILFSTDARSTLATGLSLARTSPAGFASDTSGYVAGGNNFNFDPTRVDTVDKFLFSTDARSTLATGLSSSIHSAAGFASNTNGYVAGGDDDQSTVTDTVDKFLFETDARSTLAPGLSAPRTACAGFAG